MVFANIKLVGVLIRTSIIEMKNILFFGDSLTAGYGLRFPSTEAFPALLAKIAKDEALAFSFKNAGVSGDTTSSALQRLAPLLEPHTDIFVVALGANDMLRGYLPTTMAQNLEKIITQIQKVVPTAKILLLGMELPSWITAQRAAQYRDIYSNLARKYQLTFLPFLLEGVIGSRQLNLPDLVHPNAAGYVVIANRVWPLLRKML